MSGTGDDGAAQPGIGKDRFLRMLDGRLGSSRDPRLRVLTISLDPVVVERLDDELDRLIGQWAEPGDRGWWRAHGLGDLRSVFIEAAIRLWLDGIAQEQARV